MRDWKSLLALQVRPAGDAWLVSASTGLLDGYASPALAAALGWDSPPSAHVLAAQLQQLGAMHPQVGRALCGWLVCLRGASPVVRCITRHRRYETPQLCPMEAIALWLLQTAILLSHSRATVQVEDPALQETLGRAASQLYTALGERMAGAGPEAEVVRSVQILSTTLLLSRQER